ncbi:hypothetical protein MMC24_006295 [Lignoscripta atroalba]|nr:hypothetical protein [Lignoscripta atroalba]
MATAIRGYIAAHEILKTPGFFTAAIQADNENPFEMSFMNGNASVERSIEEGQQQQQDHKSFMRAMNDDYASPMFGFSPRGSPVPYNSQPPSSMVTNLAPLMAWNGLKQEKAFQYKNPLIQVQEFSPPNSAINSPERWPYNTIQSQATVSPLHNIVTQNHARNPRMQHGQVTPPDDCMPDTFQAQHQHPNLSQSQTEHSTINGKRKRAYKTAGDSSQATKRPRKSSYRSKAVRQELNPTNMGNPEEEKRSKFLERNRVAASKCRQKKKEWTSNLEARARDLQNTKNQFALVVSSLRDEILFLKGEMLKHNGCNCTKVTEYLGEEAKHITSPNQPFESAASPVQSEPNSRAGSVSPGQHSRQGSHDSVGKAYNDSGSEVVHFKSEDQLEELLAGQLVHESNDQATETPPKQ